MTRSIRTIHVALVVAGLVGFLALPSAASAANRKHHISLLVGYQKYTSDDLKPTVDLGGGPFQTDFSNAGVGSLSYRFSIAPNLDLTLDGRAAGSQDDVGGIDVTLTSSYFGPGIRLIGPNEGLRPYVQASLLFVDEELEFEYQNLKISSSESGVGFGIFAGMDIRASNLISVPIQGEFTYAKPEDDLTAIGASVGITFNFGELQ